MNITQAMLKQQQKPKGAQGNGDNPHFPSRYTWISGRGEEPGTEKFLKSGKKISNAPEVLPSTY